MESWALVLMSFLSMFILGVLVCGICSIVTKNSEYIRMALEFLLVIIIAFAIVTIGVLIFIFWAWVFQIKG